MKISLRAGEKLYVNGAVFSVDRRVSLNLLNDATFLLEAHVMQEAEATTPLRQIYFAIQTMLMDPAATGAIRTSVYRMVGALMAAGDDPPRCAVLRNVCLLLDGGRPFDALREVRNLYRSEETKCTPTNETHEEAATPWMSTR